MSNTTTEIAYKCVCMECGKEFDSTDLIIESGTTMSGYGDKYEEYLSPCCNADYEDVGE